MYRAGVEGILGIRREGAFLVIEPCIPDAWPGFEATVNLALTLYRIRIENPSPRARDDSDAVLDGFRIHVTEGRVRVPLDGGTHSLLIDVRDVNDQLGGKCEAGGTLCSAFVEVWPTIYCSSRVNRGLEISK
jgi:hypothetical protein